MNVVETNNIQDVRRERLRQLIFEKYDTLSYLAHCAGKSSSQLSTVLNGARGFGEKLARSIEETLGLPDGWLDQPSKESFNPPPEAIALGLEPVRRVRFKLNAGVLGWAVDQEGEEAEPLFFRGEWLKRRGFHAESLLALKVRGNSMEPTLYDGDTVVINRGDIIPMHGEVVAVNYEGECVIKRLKRDAGEWWLASDNSDKRRYPDQRAENVATTIIGRVVYRSSETI